MSALRARRWSPLAVDAATIVHHPLVRGLSFKTTARAAWTGACAVMDQGLFAASNFAINVALARWLAPDAYGAFTTAYATFLILATVHTAVLAEPLIIFGAKKYRDTLPSYFAVLQRAHWLLTGLLSALLAAFGAVLTLTNQGELGRAFFALAIATPLILLQWLTRRASYVRIGPHLAVSGGALYMTVLAGAGYLLVRYGWMSSVTALLLMGGGSAISALWIRYALGMGRPHPDPALRRSVVEDHWTYGRWAIGTGFLGALMLNIYYIVMPAARGLESAATLRALSNFVLPAMQAFYALAVPAVPALVRVRHLPQVGQTLRRLMWLYGVGAFVYWLAIGLAHRPLVHWLYGDKYLADSGLLWLLALLPFTSAGVSVFESGLRALERSADICRAYVLAVVVSIVVGVPAAIVGDTLGAVVGLLISSTVAIVALGSMLRSRLRALTGAGGGDGRVA
jgi:O-antigen/teichoic acid export membrane protein